MSGPVPALESRARACADRLCEADAVLHASHIDADGLTSGAIATTALRRAGIPVETVFEKQLDEAAIARMAASDYDVVLFTDFGSGQLDVIAEYEADGAFTPVIADHHQPAGWGTDEQADTEFHLNPLLEGIDGASELSGAGSAYVLARALADANAESGAEADADANTGTPGPSSATDGGVDAAGTDAGAAGDNRDLAALAVVGAVGDMQASAGELSGANAGIVEEGVEAGVIETGQDLSLYGKQTRPLPKLLEYAGELRIPGISNDEGGCVRFLDGLDLELRSDDDGDWRTWADLDSGERKAVVSALVRRAIDRGVPAGRIDDIVGTTYELAAEAAGTELRDASEFSTLLNATARYERPDVGLAVCLGNRDGALTRARRLLANHRRNLSSGLDLVRREGVTQAQHVQWFDAGDRIRETIVGIVAGMAMGTDGVDGGRPIVAFADADEGETKVSARGTHRLVRGGLDLSAAMTEAARAVGGDGGGHDVAAGATIPAGQEAAFVEHVDRIVGEQLG